MTVLDGQQEPQEMEDRDRIDIAKNRCAIVFHSKESLRDRVRIDAADGGRDRGRNRRDQRSGEHADR